MLKKHLFLVCLSIFTANTFILSAEEPASDKESVINLESANLEYNLGDVKKDTIISKTIKIRNKLDEAIYIKEAVSTCECTEIKVEPQKVEKGEFFQAQITFNSQDFNQGSTERIVYILTDSLKYELIHFKISANIT